MSTDLVFRSSGPPSLQFSDLCNEISRISGGKVEASIERIHASKWVARITASAMPESAMNCRGEGMSLEEACNECIASYNERQRIVARKRELLKDPQVREALNLFGATAHLVPEKL